MCYVIVLLAWFQHSEGSLESVVSSVDNISFATFNDCVRLFGHNDSVSGNADETVDVNTEVTRKTELSSK